MTTKEGIFDLEAKDLYEKAKKDLDRFIGNPDEDSLLNVLFSLNHLRDWIYPPGHTSYEGKSDDELSKEQTLHKELHNNKDYKIVRELCNRAKHVQVQGNQSKTSVKEGLIAGIARAGDRLGQRNYLVEGEDLRGILENVFNVYSAYFEN